jgi:hypothetical protein
MTDAASHEALRATAAMIQAAWPDRWEGDLAGRLEELARRTAHDTLKETS